MLQSPSKFLPRTFLKALIENRFISPSGREYCKEEVESLLIEKESKLALSDFAREIKERNSKPVIDHFKIIRSFQDSVLSSLEIGDHKNLSEKPCQEITPCELITADTIFPLSRPKAVDLIGSPTNTALFLNSASENQQQSRRIPRVMTGESHRGKGKPMRYYQGYKVISKERVYSSQELRKERLEHEAMMARIKEQLHAIPRSTKSN